jgi:hypothetical protein
MAAGVERHQLVGAGDRGRRDQLSRSMPRPRRGNPAACAPVAVGSAERGPSDQLESRGRGHRLDEQQRGQY